MAQTINIPREFVVEFGASNAATAVGATGSYNGQAYYQIGGASQGYRCNIWIWDTTAAAWSCMPIAPIQGSGNPNGIVTPDSYGQRFLATDSGNYYVATGLTNNDWTLTN